MAKNDDIKKMSDDDLMREWTALGKEVTKQRERLTAFSHEYQKRTRIEQMNLQPGDLELLQEASARGIVSEEAVN